MAGPSWTKPFLRTYTTHIFFRILDIPFYLSTRPYDILDHPWHTIYTYQLDTYCSTFFRILEIPLLRIYSTINILSHPRQNHFYVPTRLNDILLYPRHSISTYLLNHNYSCSPWTKPFLRTYSTMIFFRILDIQHKSRWRDRWIHKLGKRSDRVISSWNLEVGSAPLILLLYPWLVYSNACWDGMMTIPVQHPIRHCRNLFRLL